MGIFLRHFFSPLVNLRGLVNFQSVSGLEVTSTRHTVILTFSGEIFVFGKIQETFRILQVFVNLIDVASATLRLQMLSIVGILLFSRLLASHVERLQIIFSDSPSHGLCTN